MWTSMYLEDILLRERNAEAERLAAVHHLLRGATPPRPQASIWERVSRRLRHCAQSLPGGLFAGVAAPSRKVR